ncbi:MAG: DUF4923 family protein [Bacteroidaceae bacterium]
MKKTNSFFLVLFVLSFFFVNQTKAQSFFDFFTSDNAKEKVESTVSKALGISLFDIQNTWICSGSSVELESDNPLKILAGEAAEEQIEIQLDKQISSRQIDIKRVEISFLKDKTFSIYDTQTKKKATGTYTFDNKNMLLTLGIKDIEPVNMKIKGTSTSLEILLRTDKLLELISKYGGKIEDPKMQAFVTLAQSYEGMQMGVKLRRK